MGNAHFVDDPDLSEQARGNVVPITGKVAGLGNIPQIHVEASGDAQCVNRGGNEPQAANKESFSVDGDFPVQNGKADFEVSLEATLDPECSPPMTIEWSNIKVTVTADDGTNLTYP